LPEDARTCYNIVVRVLVTGSSGQLGAVVARELQSQQHEVTAVDLVPGNETTQSGSVTDRDLTFDLARGCDAIIHTASLHAAHLQTHSAAQFIDTNLHGTLNLLDAAAAHGIRRFVYTSTTSLYGHAMERADQAVWVTEDLVPQPRDIYDITKIAAEQLCAAAAARQRPQMTCLSLRVSRFFAEDPRLLAIYRLYRGVDVRDAAAAHVLALEAPLSGYDVFNISAHSPFAKDHLHRLKFGAAAVLRAQFPWIDEAFQRRAWDLPASIDRVYVTEKAERVLHYRPKFGLVQFLQESPELEARRRAGLLF
jgi:nucleoside-diphosphate-sugar epimerase